MSKTTRKHIKLVDTGHKNPVKLVKSCLKNPEKLVKLRKKGHFYWVWKSQVDIEKLHILPIIYLKKLHFPQKIYLKKLHIFDKIPINRDFYV